MINKITQNIILVLAVYAGIFLFSKAAFADETVELPQEELAQESVYPIFDKPTSVRNRNVITAGRVDADLFYSTALTEPISSVNKFGLGLYYNLNEDHALGIYYTKNSTGLSTYAQQLHSQFGLDFNRAPKPDSSAYLDWNIKAFYGKMSLTKSIVFNLSLFGTVSAGMVKYASKSYAGAAIGLGQRFYITKQTAIRFDMRLFANQAPIPFLDGALHDGTGGHTYETPPTDDQFKERMTYTTCLDLGLSYLF